MCNIIKRLQYPQYKLADKKVLIWMITNMGNREKKTLIFIKKMVEEEEEREDEKERNGKW